jgi:hypothetical protein
MSARAARWRSIARGAIVVAALVATCVGAARVVASFSGGPLGVVPGGRLSGPLAADQEPDWSFTEQIDTIAIEVDPDDPLSVTTWVFTLDGELFVAADFFNPWKSWPRRALEDPRVRLRIGDAIYERRAELVGDPAQIERLRRAIADKYAIAPDGLASRIDVWFFRMAPRGAPPG